MPKPRNHSSYGIALFKITDTGPKMLIIKKRCSFHYAKFTLGDYDMRELRDLFDKMTSSEKITIMTFDFEHIWFKMWLYNSTLNLTKNYAEENTTTYLTKATKLLVGKKKFQELLSTFTRQQLNQMIKDSATIDGIWEIPKGQRKNNKELIFDCAVREFEEEICIEGKDYKILNATGPYHFEHKDDGETFHSYFYVAALVNEDWSPSCSMKKYHYIAESDQVSWATLDILQELNTLPIIRELLVQQFSSLDRVFLDHVHISKNANRAIEEKGALSNNIVTFRFTREVADADCRISPE